MLKNFYRAIWIIFIWILCIQISYGQKCQWAQKISGINAEYVENIAVDASGNIYIAGYSASSTITFNNGIYLYNTGSYDAYIAKYNSNGICQWAQKVSGTSEDYCKSIKVDASGNIYIAGYSSSSTLNFNNGISLTNSGPYNGFIAKYNLSGTCQWAQKISGAKEDYVESIAVDSNRNIYIVGNYFSTILDFNNGISLNNMGLSNDGFLAKYNSSGICQWAQNIGCIDGANSTSVAVYGSENIYISGWYGNSILYFNNGISLNNNGSWDNFIAKYNSSGTCQWAQNISGPVQEYNNFIAVDGSGNIYVTGNFASSIINFNNGISLANKMNCCTADIYLARFNPKGICQWAQCIGGNSDDKVNSILIDGLDDIYIGGTFYSSTLFFNGNISLNSCGGNSYISKYSSNGICQWAEKISGINGSEVFSITTDETNNIYAVGSWYTNTLLYFNNGISLIGSNYSFDVFITKYYTNVQDTDISKISLIEPENSSTKLPVNVNCDWTNAPNAGYYNVQFATNLDFSYSATEPDAIRLNKSMFYQLLHNPQGHILTDDELAYLTNPTAWVIKKLTSKMNIRTSGSNCISPTLSNLLKYYWRVRANSCNSYDQWSDIRSFETMDSLTLISPSTSSTITTSSITFNWNNVGATRYELYVDNNSDFSSPEIYPTSITAFQNYTSTTFSTDGINLSPNTYYAKVKAYIGSDLVSESSTISFLYSPQGTSFPSLTLSKSLLQKGDNLIISGSKFNSNATVNLNISGPNSFTFTENCNNGQFSQNFLTDNNSKPGTYNIEAFDQTTGYYAKASFRIADNIPFDDSLRLLAPLSPQLIGPTDLVEVVWLDNINYIYGDSLDASKTRRFYSYQVQYSSDYGTNWYDVSNAFYSGFASIGQQTRSNSFIKASQIADNIMFRVQERTPSRSQIAFKKSDNQMQSKNKQRTTPPTGLCTTSNISPTDFTVTKLWDCSYPDLRAGNPKGVCADGVSRIYLDLVYKGTSNIDAVRINLNDDSKQTTEPRLLGKIMISNYSSSFSLYNNNYVYYNEGNSATYTTVFDKPAKGAKERLYCYVAPDDFARDQNDNASRIINVNFIITINGKDYPLPAAVPIEIVRPPLMLVHGLGSSPSMWNNFKHNGNQFLDYKGDYFLGYNYSGLENDPGRNIAITLLPTSDFNTNAGILFTPLYDRISYFRKMGYSCNRVDYVAHSMGGVVARVAESKRDRFYCARNYNKGYINKLITIDSPHNGSPAANYLQNSLGYINNKGNDLFTAAYFKFGKDLQNFFNIVNYKMISSYIYPYFRYIPQYDLTDAVKNLQLPNKSGYCCLPTTNIKSHFVYGQFMAPPSNKDEKDIFKLFWAITDGLFPWWDYDQISSRMNDEIYKISSKFPNFITNSDLIVPNSSQNCYGASNSTLVNYVCHTNVYNSDLPSIAGNKVFELLNISITNNAKFNVIPPSSVIEKKDDPTPSISKVEILEEKPKFQTAPTLKIIQPDSISSYNTNDYIPIKFSLSDIIGLNYVQVFFQGEFYFDTTKKVEYNFNIPVTGKYLGNREIIVFANYEYSDTSFVLSSRVSSTISTSDSLLGIEVEPKEFYFPVNFTRKLDYQAIYSTFLSDLSMSKKLSVEFSVPDIVKFDTTNTFIALKEGNTRAIVSYENQKDTIYITVDAPLPYPISSIKKPIIQSQKRSVIVCQNDDAILFVKVSGDSIANRRVFQYQWQRNGQDIYGAIYDTLKLVNCDFSMSDIYKCIITNYPAMDSAITDDILVYVTPSVSITQNPVSQKVAIGGIARFEVGTMIPNIKNSSHQLFKWYKGNKLLVEDNRISGTNSNMISISNVKDTDYDSTYTVSVFDPCAKDESPNYIDSKMFALIRPDTIIEKDTAKITIKTNPQGDIRCVGENVLFTTELNDNTKNKTVTYQWYKGNTKLVDNSVYSGSTSKTLTLKGITATEQDDYQLIVTVMPDNYSISSAVAKLTVNSKPSIITQTTGIIELNLGDALSLLIKVGINSLPLSYKWYLNGVEIQNAANDYYSKAKINAKDTGNYICKVINSCGDIQSVSIRVKLKIIGTDKENIETSSDYYLYPCTPNPFDDYTSIKFALPQSGHVKLAISDISGRELIILADKFYNTGTSEIKFKAGDYNLIDGTYFYSISVNGFKDTKKMVLIK
ncbi:MAG: SBBP repeat-containing protein [Candidatus Kapabacteria bacterium]|nr:SBBP repeat-containing protein [Candidatus Kapabacteria bacterium]